MVSAVRGMKKIRGSTEDGTNFALENQGGLHSRKDTRVGALHKISPLKTREFYSFLG